MTVCIGYLLPTRESVMEGHHAAAPLLKLAEKAEDLGFDSVWVGDSLLARPRHEPLTLLAGVAGRTTNIALGTAILLPALRNPVVWRIRFQHLIRFQTEEQLLVSASLRIKKIFGMNLWRPGFPLKKGLAVCWRVYGCAEPSGVVTQ